MKLKALIENVPESLGRKTQINTLMNSAVSEKMVAQQMHKL
jgi:hypothetical protein